MPPCAAPSSCPGHPRHHKPPRRARYIDQPNTTPPGYAGQSNWRFPDRMRGNDMKVVDATGTMILPTGKQLAAAAELRSLLSSVN